MTPIKAAAGEVSREALLEKAIKDACDLLAERTRGSSARSPGHNARLLLQGTLKKATDLTAVPAGNDGVREALHKLAVQRTVRETHAGPIWNGGFCQICKCEWDEPFANNEHHTADCIIVPSLPQAREAGEPPIEAAARAMYEYEPWEDGTTWGTMPEASRNSFRETMRFVFRETASPPPIHDAAVGAIEKILFDHFYTGEPGQHEAMAQAAKALRALKPQDTGSEK